MKKNVAKVLALILAVVSCIGLMSSCSAPSVAGTYTFTVDPTDVAGNSQHSAFLADAVPSQVNTLVLNEDGTYSFIDELTMSTEPAPTMALEIATSIDIKGTYTLEGDKLTLTPDIDTYKYEILSISVNGQVGANPMIKSQINAIFKSPEFKEQFAAVQENTVKVGDASLEMTNEGTTVNFVRFATIEN